MPGLDWSDIDLDYLILDSCREKVVAHALHGSGSGSSGPGASGGGPGPVDSSEKLCMPNRARSS
jgi:hypothetical protein